MHSIFRKLFFFLFVLLSSNLFATHIVGGYFRYECMGLLASDTQKVEYRVEFHFFRDATNGQAPMPDSLPVTLFKEGTTSRGSFYLRRDTIINQPNTIDNPCFVNVDTIVIQEGIFFRTISTDRNAAYQLVHQRCCRNRGVANLSTSNRFGDTHFYGNTFESKIPEFDVAGCNSTPKFDKVLPILFCAKFDAKDIELELTATDPDNDSLVYSFCAPFDYNRDAFGSADPGAAPIFANFPPYDLLPFKAPQSAEEPIPSDPFIQIDPKSGKITGTPTTPLENYVIGVCVEEYRRGSGVLINVTRRDIQIRTANCDPIIVNSIQDQEQFCSGLEVSFSNNSTSNAFEPLTYKWDFGVSSVESDTSDEFEPTFDYTPYGKGVYFITLIVNPGSTCSDTTVKRFELSPILNAEIKQTGDFCSDRNSVDFAVVGSFDSDATFEWDFSAFANQSSSTNSNVNDVKFSGPINTFPIRLIVKQDNCTQEIIDSVVVFDQANVQFSLNDSAGCYPFPVDFINTSTSIGITEYDWDFGDGNTSSDENPTHIYTANGKYDVSLELRTTEGCIDTLNLTKPDLIDISLDSSINKIEFDIVPPEGCPPFQVDFIDQSTFDGTAQYFWDLGDGNISTAANATNIYTDTGNYSIGLLVITSGKCVDTLVKTFNDTIRVNSIPVSALTSSDNAKPLKEALFLFNGRGSQFAEKSKFLINGNEIDTVDFLSYQFQDTGHFIVDYIVFNEFGCTDTSSAEVFVFDEFEFIIPNVFTPNNDGINESFAIRACGVYEYEINIYDRKGTEVFKSNSLNIQWDGTISGRNAHSGVYYYTILIKDFRGEYINYNGTVTVIVD